MTRLTVALAMLALALGACSSKDEPPVATGPDRLDPCSVLTAKDLATHARGRLVRREKDPQTPTSRCFYLLGTDGQVNVTSDNDQGKNWFGAVGTGDAVTGVGDEAKWVPASQLLAAYDGKAYVAVQVISAQPEPERKKVAIALARAALSRMT